MRLVALVFAVLAALMHLYIFWMESLRWQRPETPQGVRHFARAGRGPLAGSLTTRATTCFLP